MKKGAADFLLKPFDREEILFTVRKQIAAARHAEQPPAAEAETAPAVITARARCARFKTSFAAPRAAPPRS